MFSAGHYPLMVLIRISTETVLHMKNVGYLTPNSLLNLLKMIL